LDGASTHRSGFSVMVCVITRCFGAFGVTPLAETDFNGTRAFAIEFWDVLV